MDFQGPAHWFLAMRITRDHIGNYTLDQARYIKTVTDKFLRNPESENDPITQRFLPADFLPTKNDCSLDEKSVKLLETEFGFEYSSVIGSLNLHFKYSSRRYVSDH